MKPQNVYSFEKSFFKIHMIVIAYQPGSIHINERTSEMFMIYHKFSEILSVYPLKYTTLIFGKKLARIILHYTPIPSLAVI
jgi:hypothetical protein